MTSWRKRGESECLRAAIACICRAVLRAALDLVRRRGATSILAHRDALSLCPSLRPLFITHVAQCAHDVPLCCLDRLISTNRFCCSNSAHARVPAAEWESERVGDRDRCTVDRSSSPTLLRRQKGTVRQASLTSGCRRLSVPPRVHRLHLRAWVRSIERWLLGQTHATEEEDLGSSLRVLCCVLVQIDRVSLCLSPSSSLLPMSSKTLLQWLQGAGLEGLYDTFVAHDVTAERLATLQFHDYDRMEIIEPPLRQKLFRLVQMVKREAPPAAAPAPAPTPVQQPSQPAFAPTQVLPRNILPPAAAPNPVRAKQPAPSQLPQPMVKAQPRYEEPPQQQAPPQQASAPARNRRVSAVPQQAQQPQPPPQQQAPAPRPAPIPQQQPPPPPQQQEYDEDDNGGEVFDDDVDEDVDDDYDGSLIMDSGGGGLEDVPKIRVAVRKRPLNSKERDTGQVDVVTVKATQVTIHEPKQKVDLTRYVESHKFSFDEVFADESTNEEIYQATCKPLVHFFINAGGKKGGGGKGQCDRCRAAGPAGSA